MFKNHSPKVNIREISLFFISFQQKRTRDISFTCLKIKTLNIFGNSVSPDFCHTVTDRRGNDLSLSLLQHQQYFYCRFICLVTTFIYTNFQSDTITQWKNNGTAYFCHTVTDKKYLWHITR